PVGAPVTPAPSTPAPVAPGAPSVPAPRVDTPVAALAAPASLAVEIVGVKRVGARIALTVSAPAGSRVTLWRNGKKVATNSTGRFSVPAGRISVNSFVAVAKSGKVSVSSTRVVVRATSSRLR
ncbi:MAG: hypothetical protein ACKOQ7_09470, partial [Actinomycetota bacterium]